MRSLLGCGLTLLVVLDAQTTATQTPPLRFVAVTAGADHVCALTDDGNSYCWGGNWHGQLGVGDRDGDPAAPCCYKQCCHAHGTRAAFHRCTRSCAGEATCCK